MRDNPPFLNGNFFNATQESGDFSLKGALMPMPRRQLVRHPTIASPDWCVEARARARASGAIEFSYRVSGAIDALLLPKAETVGRKDELWRTTCFEAFVKPDPDAPDYLELNFAPSGDWAAYQFSDYRDGMRPAGISGAPKIAFKRNANSVSLTATVAFARATRSQTPRLALAAVLEDLRGEKSYWALAFPPGKPDFHHADCFVYELTKDAQP